MAARGEVVAHRECILDAVLERGVHVARSCERRHVDVAGRDERPVPGDASVLRVVHQDIDTASAVLRVVVDQRRVDHTIRIHVREEVCVVVGGIQRWQLHGSCPVAVRSVAVSDGRLDVRFAAVAVEIHVHHVDPVEVGIR